MRDPSKLRVYPQAVVLAGTVSARELYSHLLEVYQRAPSIPGLRDALAESESVSRQLGGLVKTIRKSATNPDQ